MRFRSPLAVAAIAAIAACSDDSRSPLPTQPHRPNADVSITQLVCDAAGQARVREIIGILYAGKSAANSREGNLLKFRQGMEFPLPALQLQRFKKFIDIMRKVDDDYEAGRLPNLTNPTEEALIAELIARLFVCAGYDEPDVPEGGDVIICIIGDPGQKHTWTAKLKKTEELAVDELDRIAASLAAWQELRDKLGREIGITLGAALPPTVLDDNGAALDPAKFT